MSSSKPDIWQKIVNELYSKVTRTDPFFLQYLLFSKVYNMSKDDFNKLSKDQIIFATAVSKILEKNDFK